MDRTPSELQAAIEAECLRHALRFPEVFRVYREQYRTPRTREQLRARQRERLGALLGRVLTEVPAFRRLGVRWRPGADPFEVLAVLPPMCKAQVVAAPDDHVTDRLDPSDCVAVRTSGTTGEPLRILHSNDHLVHAFASELARVRHAGLALDRKTLLPFKMGGQSWMEYTMVTTGFNRIAEFGFLDGDPAGPRLAVARRCVEFAPDVVFSHPSRCVALVELLTEAGVTSLPVSVVRTFGEKLTAPVRRLLAGFFGGRVRDTYGMNEVSTLAAECEAGRMHLDDDRLWVEMLDREGEPVPAGAPGEITVTNLFNAVMPFVRYRTGDVGSLDPAACECGRASRVLRLLAGRDPGMIRLPDGRRVDALRVVRALEQFPVRRFQVVQPDRDRLTVLVTPISPITPEHGVAAWQGRVVAAVRAAVGSGLSVRVVPAGAESYHGAGAEKLNSFVSLLPEQRTGAPEGGDG